MATPTATVSSQSTALPPRPALQTTPMSALIMTGKPGPSSVVYLREARQRTISDWIRQLLPTGWQFRQQNAATPALNKRLPSWSVNDQWHRALNALLAGQQLYGHMDWNRKILTVTTTATPPVDLTAPQGSQKAADTPRNPFRGSTATPAGPTQVTPAVSASRPQTTTGTSGTPESRTTTPAPVATKPPAPSPQKVTPPRQWKMEKGTTLKDGLARWTSSENAPTVPGRCAGKRPLTTALMPHWFSPAVSARRWNSSSHSIPRLKNRCMPGPAQHNVCCG